LISPYQVKHHKLAPKISWWPRQQKSVNFSAASRDWPENRP